MSPEPRFAVTGAIPEEALNLLAGAGTLAMPAGPGPLPAGELREHVAGADAIVTLLHDRVNADLLAAAGPQLRCVCNVAVGYDNVDLAAAAAAKVTVTNTPGVLTDATADLTLGLILAVTRRLGEGERLVRRGEPWRWSMDFMLGAGLQGKRLGIIGMGEIGSAVARRGAAFGMEIVYSRRQDADAPGVEGLGAQRLPLEEVIRTADFLSLHCPLSDETHHLIGARELAAMKPTAYLINTARGPVVAEEALVDALDAGAIAGAALDVFEHEPQIDPRLLSHENLVAVPHLGSATTETRIAMATLAARNAIAICGGEPALTPVDATQAASGGD